MNNRLNLLKYFDKYDVASRPPLRGIAIGIGKWLNKKQAVINNWPIYINFKNNLIPDFLRKTNKPKSNFLTLDNNFKDRNFYLNGGDENKSKAIIKFGTLANPGIKAFNVSIAVEKVSRMSSKEFFYLLTEDLSEKGL